MTPARIYEHAQQPQWTQVPLHKIQHHTSIKSSAPIERLFIQAACILTKRRNRLTDEMFEKLLLLKPNWRTAGFGQTKCLVINLQIITVTN